MQQGSRQAKDHYKAATKHNLRRHIKKRHAYVGKSSEDAREKMVSQDLSDQDVPGKVHQCDQCDYVAKLSHLNRHVKSVHDKKRDYACENCDYKAAQNSNLKEHVKAVHEKIKNFACEQCDYKAAQKSYLVMHVEAIHDRIKRFACEHCHYKAAVQPYLREHMKRRHPNVGNSSEDTTKKMEKCQLCEYETASEESLTKHLMSVHVQN